MDNGGKADPDGISAKRSGNGDERSQRPIWLGIDERRFDHMRVHVALLRDGRLGAIEHSVYLGLVAHAELQSGECFPSVATLTEYSAVSEKRVRIALHRLREAGWIRTAFRAGKASEYRLLPPPVIPTPAPDTDLPETGPVPPTDLGRYLSLSRSVPASNAIRNNQNQEPKPLNDAGARVFPHRVHVEPEALARIPEPRPWCERCEGAGWVDAVGEPGVVECPSCGPEAGLRP